ncbi:MAG: hypothetical protein JXQ29_00935 [Planctomycetes bacterium]|nr:hypothetical protein [Planctomycetota bacterium]
MRSLVSSAFWMGLALVATTSGQASRRAPEMRWAESVAAGVEEARLRNVPIVLHLHSDT